MKHKGTISILGHFWRKRVCM